MFCPQCRVEYREGFTECSDCRVPLVAELPSESEAQGSTSETAEVLVTEDPEFLDQAIAVLQEAEIQCFLQSGGVVIGDDEEIDLDDGPVSVHVAVAEAGEAQECLRELLERYSLSEEGLEDLHRSLEEEMAAFVNDEPGALVAAAEAGASAAVEKLLERGDDVNQQNESGQTALMVASDAGEEELVKTLLEAGALVNAADDDGIRALHFAAHKGRGSIVALLLEKGAEVDAQHSEGLTALMLAAENGHLECVRLLVAEGADVTLRDSSGTIARSLAKRMGYTRVEGLLRFKERLSAGQDSELDSEGRDVLMAAAVRGETDLVGALLDAGADIGATDAEGRTALIWAALEGQAGAAEMLIGRGAAVDTTDPDGGTALSWAADRGETDVVRVLLKHGADPNLKDSQGWTPEMWATDKGHHETAEVLRAAVEGKLG